MSDHLFLVMWCNEGLEYVTDLTAHEQRMVWAALKGEEAQGIPNLHHLILRAQFNPQRCYEIYTVSAVEGITTQDIKDMFEDSPQAAADLIRERGRKLYSDRATKKRQVIE